MSGTGLVLAGAAVVDITPPVGLPLSGFAARTAPATGAHDPLTARALAVGDTALVVADVIGLDAGSSARIRARSPLPDDAVVVAALHTHGGPVSLAGGLGRADPAVLAAIEDGCVAALAQAVAARRPCQLAFGIGPDPGVARNRRRADGPRDDAVPVIEVRDEAGRAVAILVSHACHPVVLGADNTLWTADYPHFARRELEAARPGAVALFATGCAGDVNTGHKATASFTTEPMPLRTFEEAERVGRAISESALQAVLQPCTGVVAAASATLNLGLRSRDTLAPAELAAIWRSRLPSSPPGQAALLREWIRWATTVATRPLEPVPVRVSALDWGGIAIAALPGEPFYRTGATLRDALGARAIVIAYAGSCPGYLPPADDYGSGGYEVDDAHRYYGLPAPFAPGSAERVVEVALALSRRRPEEQPPSSHRVETSRRTRSRTRTDK